MKVAGLLKLLQVMPPYADVEIEVHDRYHAFTSHAISARKEVVNRMPKVVISSLTLEPPKRRTRHG